MRIFPKPVRVRQGETMKLSRTNTARRLSTTALSSLLVLALLPVQVAFAQTRNITVEVNKPGIRIPKTLFGLFFEDINFGADGGLYPERIKNRSFEFPNPMMGWKPLKANDANGQLQIFDQ